MESASSTVDAEEPDRAVYLDERGTPWRNRPAGWSS
jgi:hypothetical protein